MPRYQVRGTDPETDQPVVADIGWSPTDHHFAIVGEQVWNNIDYYPELIELTHQYINWDTRARYAIRDAQADWYKKNNPGSPATKILETTR